MESLFGLPLTLLMAILAAVFGAAMLVIMGMAARNTVMFKMGIRPISRRPGMTALIIIGVMLSTIIISAAFGTADTLTHSIRDVAITGLREIDEIIVPSGAQDDAAFGQSFIPAERFELLRADIAGDDRIDGLMPQLAVSVPSLNPDANLSEGQLQLVGVDPAHFGGFGELHLISGQAASIAGLADGEAFLNAEGADELAMQPGGRLLVYVEEREIPFTIRGILRNESFAGIQPTLLLSLDAAREALGRPGQINSIAVSNRGDAISGNDLSDEATLLLRANLADAALGQRLKEGLKASTFPPELAWAISLVEELQEALNQPEFLAALESQRDDAEDAAYRDALNGLHSALQAPEVSEELILAFTSSAAVRPLLETLERDDLREVRDEASPLLAQLSGMRVIKIKATVISSADSAGSAVTTFFLTFSVFSIASGILLIFLIFVLLAGARKSEMGMARAVGAKRRHLIQMFVFEGTAYALVSAAIGVALGLLVATLMVEALNSIFTSFDDSFRLSLHFSYPSIVVSYCLGMVITLVTVAVSAYRVSHLNIVAAVRNLPDTFTLSARPNFWARLRNLLKGVARPLLFLWRALRSLLKGDPLSAALNLSFAIAWIVLFPILWAGDIMIQSFRLFWPYVMQGWLIIILGSLLAWASIAFEGMQRWSWFGGGITLVVVGCGLFAQTLLARGGLRSDIRDRVIFTAVGVIILTFWALPSAVLERALGSVVSEFEGDIDVMFVSGIAMVGAAVWTVMYNADALLRGIQFGAGRLRRLRPALVTAVAYPLSAKFRTGLTLKMFALVIFTLTIMSVLTETFSTQFVDARVATGGWDIEGRVNLLTPIDDIRGELDRGGAVDIARIESIGGFTSIPMNLQEGEAEDDSWSPARFVAADDDYLDSTDYQLKLIAEGYGETPEEAFDALRADPSLVLIGGEMLSDRQGERGELVDRVVQGVSYNDDSMQPIAITMREPTTRSTLDLTIIGVIDRVHDAGFGIGVIGSIEAVEAAAPFPIPITTYRFRVADTDEAKDIAQKLESSLLVYGMETVVLEEFLNDLLSGVRGFFRLLTGFMALGLFVGIAALGVVSTRAVVERRQQIGVLRAIGYRRGMIRLSFLFESSFIVLLGAAIGGALGLALSYNAVSDLRAQEGIDTIRFSVPWAQLAIIFGLTYFFSLLSTYVPANQASKVSPADALRYE